MSGSRTKWLRRAFIKKYGRPPLKFFNKVGEPNEWRRVKRHYNQTGEVTSA